MGLFVNSAELVISNNNNNNYILYSILYQSPRIIIIIFVYCVQYYFVRCKLYIVDSKYMSHSFSHHTLHLLDRKKPKTFSFSDTKHMQHQVYDLPVYGVWE